jgi:hypothetical protein
VDLQGAREFATQMLSPSDLVTYQSTVAPLVQPLRFFGGSSRGEANGDSHAHLFLGIQKP